MGDDERAAVNVLTGSYRDKYQGLTVDQLRAERDTWQKTVNAWEGGYLAEVRVRARLFQARKVNSRLAALHRALSEHQRRGEEASTIGELLAAPIDEYYVQQVQSDLNDAALEAARYQLG